MTTPGLRWDMAPGVRVSIVGLLVALTMAGIAGCGGSAHNAGQSPSQSQTTSPAQSCFDPGFTRPRAMYVGLTLTEASKLAKRRGEFLILVAADGACVLRSQPYYQHSVQVETRSGRVARAFADS